MVSEDLSVVSLNELGEYLDEVIKRFYGAGRLLLLPALLNMRSVDCELLGRLCCDGSSLTINYRVGDFVSVIKASLGSLSRNMVPCIMDIRRMPPLSRFVNAGVIRVSGGSLIVNYWDDYEGLLNASGMAKNVLIALQSLVKCRAYTVGMLAKCANLDAGDLYEALLTARLLYPALLELVMPSGYTVNSMLGRLGVGALIRVGELMSMLGTTEYERVVIVPSPLINELAIRVVDGGWGIPKPSLHRFRAGRVSSRANVGDGVVSVRSGVTRYSIPAMLDLVRFRGVVADIGCGFGVKGTYGLRRGASYVILLDIDEYVLRLRRSGWAVDRVVADARMLPLRDSSIDVAIVWNVVNFIRERERALGEVRRVCRGDVVYSIYNAANAHWLYGYEDFLNDILSLGKPLAIRRGGNAQFQAVVRVLHGEHKD